MLDACCGGWTSRGMDFACVNREILVMIVARPVIEN